MTKPLSLSPHVLNDQDKITDEIISISKIEKKIIFSDDDPRNLEQKIRTFTNKDNILIKRISQSPYFNMDDFLKKYRHSDITTKILELLNHEAFQFNSKKRFRASKKWVERMQSCIEKNQPIKILILAFCVINNPLKRFGSTTATTAEDVSMLHLSNICDYISRIYKPGAKFDIISDSTFYSVPCGVNSVEAAHYISALKSRIHFYKIEKNLEIHDISDFLLHHSAKFNQRFEFWREKFIEDPLIDGLSIVEYHQWFNSMKAGINTRKFNFDYKKLKGIFNNLDISIEADKTGINLLVKESLAEYRALKTAAFDIQWEDLYFPLSIRATIHTKKIPVMGLRLYPEYKLKSKFLPYHGIAAIYSPLDSEPHLSIEPEISLCGNPEFTRVINNDGITLFYEKVG